MRCRGTLFGSNSPADKLACNSIHHVCPKARKQRRQPIDIPFHANAQMARNLFQLSYLFNRLGNTKTEKNRHSLCNLSDHGRRGTAADQVDVLTWGGLLAQMKRSATHWAANDWLLWRTGKECTENASSTGDAEHRIASRSRTSRHASRLHPKLHFS